MLSQAQGTAIGGLTPVYCRINYPNHGSTAEIGVAVRGSPDAAASGSRLLSIMLTQPGGALRGASVIRMTPLPGLADQWFAARGSASALRGRCARLAARDHVLVVHRPRLCPTNGQGQRQQRRRKSLLHVEFLLSCLYAGNCNLWHRPTPIAARPGDRGLAAACRWLRAAIRTSERAKRTPVRF